MMIICRAAARQAYLEIRPDKVHWVNEYECFGVVPSRRKLSEYAQKNPKDFPVSHRYFALLEECPLRMSSL